MKIIYTARDFDSFFEELKNIAKLKFPSWNKFSESNIGTLFLELFAMLGDQNSYYLNRIINQIFLMTVDRRRHAVNILKKMNYKLKGREAASVDLIFTLKNGEPHTRDIIIPAGYTVKTNEGNISFETAIECTILAGEIEASVSAKNWITHTEYISLGNDAFQEKTLKNDNYIESQVELYVNGELWNEVQEDLLDYGENDKVFYVEQDNDLKAVLIFGDGNNGLVPTGTGYVKYNTGGGSEGNDLEENTLTKLTDNIFDTAGIKVDIEVTNPLSPSGGMDEESIDNARKLAPKKNRSSYTITREEYEVNAESVKGVARVLAVGKSEDPAVLTNVTNLYIVPEGGGIPSTLLKETVNNYFKDSDNGKPTVHTAGVFPMDPVYRFFEIAGTVHKEKNFLTSDVENELKKELTKYFSFDNLDSRNKYTNNFGYYKPTLFVSEIINIFLNVKINGLKCIKNVTLSAPLTDLNISGKEYPILTNLSGIIII